MLSNVRFRVVKSWKEKNNANYNHFVGHCGAFCGRNEEFGGLKYILPHWNKPMKSENQIIVRRKKPGARFSTVPKTFRARKAIRKTPTRLSRKAGPFICCTGNKIKTTAKFRAFRRLRFEDTKRIMSPEMRPKSFGTFEKRAPDTRSHYSVCCRFPTA